MFSQARTLVITFIISLMSFTTVAAADSPAAVTNGSIAQSYPGSGVVVSGKYAYVSSYGYNYLMLYDVTQRNHPVEVATVLASHTGRGIAIQDSMLYVSGTTGVDIYNLVNPASPLRVGSLDIGSQLQTIQVAGNYAYVTDWVAGQVYIIDVSNSSAPKYVSQMTVASPVGLEIKGNYAYITAFNEGALKTFNISNKAKPVLKSSTTAGNGLSSVDVAGQYMYATAQSSNQLVVFDLTNPAAPTIAGVISTGNFTNPNRVVTKNGRAYVVDINGNNPALQIFNTTTSPTAPTLSGKIPVGLYTESLFVNGQFAYMAQNHGTTDSKFQTYNVSAY